MKQAKVLNETEMKRLLRVVSTTKHSSRNRLIVMLSFLAGLRACEIAALQVKDVVTTTNGNWEVKNEALLQKEQTKGSKAQTVVLSEKLQQEIKRYVQQHKLHTKLNYPLISSQKCNGFTSQTIQNLFRSFYEAAGIDNATSHSGRRTFITRLSENGVSTRVIQELARHSSMATTQRYIDVSVDKLRTAADLVNYN